MFQTRVILPPVHTYDPQTSNTLVSCFVCVSYIVIVRGPNSHEASIGQWEQDQWHELGGAEQAAAIRNPEPAKLSDVPGERSIPVPFSDQYTLGLRDVVMVAVAAGMVVGCAALLGPAAAFVMVLREVRRR